MSFVQIIDCRTTRYDEIAKLDNDWEKATEGRRTLRRQITTRDRNDADHYEVFCFFDSYEAAMANSNLPETTAGAARYAELLDGPSRFVDLDVIEDQTLDEAAGKPGFLQIIEVRTAQVEDMRALDREYSAAVADRTTVRRAIVTQDRADREHFYVLVFFDSHASAMENSQLPETAAMAEKMARVLAAPPTFHDLDVLDDRVL
jgi:quinol monooxygenase YgiN